MISPEDFQADLERMQRGETAQLSYILIDRQRHDDAALAYRTPDEAIYAIEESLLIDGLCEEDCLDAWVPDSVRLADILHREVILPD